MEYKDYYQILGVARDADEDAIKQAYRRLARKYHPDVSKEPYAEEQFKKIQEAYAVLKDKEKRTQYDALGANWKAGQEFRPPPGWDKQSQFRYAGGQFSEEDLGQFSDFFANMFGGRSQHDGFATHAGREFRQRGSDQHAKITITLNEAYQGATRNIQLHVPELSPEGQLINQARTLKVVIPAGAEQGQQLRLAGQGAQGVGGGAHGDLYLEIDIAPHPFFSLNGRDVYFTLPITPWEAALGAEIKVPTLGGTVGLKINADAKSGQKLRLKGRGMPGKPHAGDQYAVLQIQTPPPHNDDQKKLYQQMADMMPFNPRNDWTV